MNVRWNISASINNGNASDSNKYFFMNFFYNQLGNSIQYHTTHSNGNLSFHNYWNSQGNIFTYYVYIIIIMLLLLYYCYYLLLF
jgi:hypothetical protein